MKINKKERVIWADLLRILSIFMVVIGHVSGRNMWMFEVGGRHFTICTFYALITRWAVPVFFMLSGAFLLDTEKRVDIKKYILRLILAFVGWSLVYAILYTFTAWDFTWDTVAERIWEKFYTGPYHFWFLYVMIGMYLIIPMLRKICMTSSKKELEYFLMLCCIFSVILPLFKKVEIFNIAILWLDNLQVLFVTGYVGLYVLGYYLKKYPICKSKKDAIIWIFIGIISLILSAFLTFTLEKRTGIRDDFWQGNLNITVIPQAIVLFSLMQYVNKNIMKHEIMVKVIYIVSSKVFIIYLCHDIFIHLLAYYKISTAEYDPIYSVPLLSILVFLCSFLVACIYDWCVLFIKNTVGSEINE